MTDVQKALRSVSEGLSALKGEKVEVTCDRTREGVVLKFGQRPQCNTWIKMKDKK